MFCKTQRKLICLSLFIAVPSCWLCHNRFPFENLLPSRWYRRLQHSPNIICRAIRDLAASSISNSQINDLRLCSHSTPRAFGAFDSPPWWEQVGKDLLMHMFTILYLTNSISVVWFNNQEEISTASKALVVRRKQCSKSSMIGGWTIDEMAKSTTYSCPATTEISGIGAVDNPFQWKQTG